MEEIYIPKPILPDPKLRGKGPISEWYSGKTILITGGTGFIGKVLVEKLLYQCHGLKEVYLIIRPKRGIEPEQRVRDMWELPVFDRLREVEPDAVKKIIAISGDTSAPGLGLSVEDRKRIAENVSIIFHCAATTKFNEKLKRAIELNTISAQETLNLAKEIKNLLVFVHVSTTFCSADLPEFNEKIYPPAHNPHDIIHMTKWMPSEDLELITPALIKPHPNTYTYTKRLTESIVADEYPEIPLVIARPSIVTPSMNEPTPGWIDNINGPMGLFVAAGKGIVRSIYCDPKGRINIIPVDVLSTTLIVIAHKTSTAAVRPPEIPIYNLSSGEIIPFTWEEALIIVRNIGYDYPFEKQIWYPDGNMRSTKLMHKICCIFMHWLPAYFLDFLLLLCFQDRFMVKIATRINEGLDLVEFFAIRNWIFGSENALTLDSHISEIERESFNLACMITPEAYFVMCLLGARKYLMKEDLSTIPKWRKIQKVNYVINQAVIIGLYLGLLWILCCLSENVNNAVGYVYAILQSLPLIGLILP